MYTYFYDIETSKVTCDDGSKVQITYLANLVKMNYITGEIEDSIFFRTIEESLNYFKKLEECTIWCHNLDYELTFILREIGETNGILQFDRQGRNKKGIYSENVQNIVLRDKHSPLTIILDYLPNITFRDSYALFNKSVAKLGEELNFPKLDYVYSKVRLPWDCLEEHDYSYNERDNLIVAKSIFNYMNENHCAFEDIPLTFTATVKKNRKNFILEKFGKKGIAKFGYDRKKSYKDFGFFELQLRTYQGGLTASNVNYTGMFIKEGMYSIDKKSDYPHQMCNRYFPFFTDKDTRAYTNDFAQMHFKQGNYKGFYGTFTFKNIKVKNKNYLLPISSSQLRKGKYNKDLVQFNGKLMSCSEITIPCNNIDIDTINLVYDYDEVICHEIYSTTKSRRLRTEEISFILHCFNIKENVKDKESLEYRLSKSAINGMYGIKVTSPIRSSYSIVNGEIECIDYFNFSNEDREEIYSHFLETDRDFGSNLDIFSDGCYITSYARYELIELMKEIVDMGCSVVYCDTDSLKLLINDVPRETFLNFVSKKNEEIIKTNKNNSRFKAFLESDSPSESDYNKVCKLGIWEIETPEPLPLFVTYGAKKYGYITPDNKPHITIAGCNKNKPCIAINKFAEKNNISIEESFKFILSLGTQFDESASGRTTSYSEKRSREEMDKLTYNGKYLNQYGGIIIEDTTYTLNITNNDSLILEKDKLYGVAKIVNIEGDVKLCQVEI